MVSSEFQPLVDDLASASGVRTSRQDKGRLTDFALRVVTQRQATKNRTLLAGLKSPEERRYIVAPRLYQQTAGPSVQSSLRNIESTLRSKIVRSTHETGSKVLQLSSLEAALVKERYPALLVEPDLQHSLARTPLYSSIEPVQVLAVGSKTLEIEVRGNGFPLAQARVLLLIDAQQKVGYEGFTDENGLLQISIRSADSKLSRVVVMPAAGFWSRAWADVDVSSRLTLSVEPLRIGGFDWGLSATEANARASEAERESR